jgi:hypothetical protein
VHDYVEPPKFPIPMKLVGVVIQNGNEYDECGGTSEIYLAYTIIHALHHTRFLISIKGTPANRTLVNIKIPHVHGVFFKSPGEFA